LKEPTNTFRCDDEKVGPRHSIQRPGPRPIPRSSLSRGHGLAGVSGQSTSRNGGADNKVATPRASSSSPSLIRSSIISQVNLVLFFGR
jgi:hypothetical protein